MHGSHELSFDLEQYDDNNQARVKAVAPELQTVGTADDVEDALYKSANLPGVFTLPTSEQALGRLTSRGVADQSQPARNKGMFIKGTLSLILVVRSLRSKEDALKAALPLIRKLKNGFHDWLNPLATDVFTYEGFEFLQRNVGANKTSFELRFTNKYFDDFTN